MIMHFVKWFKNPIIKLLDKFDGGLNAEMGYSFSCWRESWHALPIKFI